MGLGEKKSVLISIRPKWCELIASGKKTIEVRKTRPKIETPFKCYIYCTASSTNLPDTLFKDEYGIDICHADDYNAMRQRPMLKKLNKKIIGEFVCDIVYHTVLRATDDAEDITRYFLLGIKEIIPKFLEGCCLEKEEIAEYIPPGKSVFGWHISDLKIYDKPRELKEFIKPCPYDGNCQPCEFYSDFGGICTNILTRPPQSWFYVEENSDAEIH